MLVLTRKVGESITIGDDISVRVLEISGNNIKIGINAPRNITIYRQEVYEKIREENINSTQANSSGLLKAANLFKNLGTKE